MSSAFETDRRKAPPRAVLLSPHLVLRDFLDVSTVADLLGYALSRESEFVPTVVEREAKDEVKPHIRYSMGTRDLGPFKPIFKSKVLAIIPDLVASLRATPVEAPRLELELVAHNNGAFYKRHIDTETGATHRGVESIRVLSCVYYFHAEPKAFSGGSLRLHAIGENENHVDIEPVQNSLLVFPSWAPHEVMPVICPSRRFADSRFAVNCWVYRTKPAPAS